MPRPHRHDAPDTWHHVLNRGIAKRTIFETARDCRFFLSLLAREVRAGRIEVHAYCLMLTHFHVLIRSRTGELSEAMRRIQNRYARYFNRTRRRDGPLFRNRFKSRWIDSIRYRRNVVGYIHDNALSAGLVRCRHEYPWSSARAWRDGRPPRWLARGWIDSELTARGAGETWSDRMDAAFPDSIDADHRSWIERQLRSRHPADLEDCTLKHAASPRVVRWTVRKANLADGTRPWRPVCAANAVDRIVARSRRQLRRLSRAAPGSYRRAKALLHAGLLRMLSGLTHREIAFRTGRHRGTVAHDIQDHWERFGTSAGYARLVSVVTRAALAVVRV